MTLDFTPICLESRAEILAFLAQESYQISDITFGNLFIWKHAREISYAIFAESSGLDSSDSANARALIIQTRYAGQDPYFFFPIGGSEQTKRAALKAIDSHAKACGFALHFASIESRNLPLLQATLPSLRVESTPDRFDYVYSVAELIALSGRKFHKKKNHLNHFLAHYTWGIEPISEQNAKELMTAARTWLDSNPAKSPQLELEYQGICAALECFTQLGLRGILIRARENAMPESTETIIAFSFGEMMSQAGVQESGKAGGKAGDEKGENNESMAVIHIEKAAPHIIGAYQIINQQLLAACFPHATYANREEDLGIAGLRQAKRGYNPVFMVEKFCAR